MRKFVNRLAVVSLIGLMGAAATAIVPAGASTGVHFRVVGSHALVHPLQPNDNIVGQGSTAVYSPKKLTVAEYTQATCVPNGTDVSFTLTNTGTKTAFITYAGSVVIKLKPAAVEDICFYGGSAGAKAKFGLSNKTGTVNYAGVLKITLSN